MSSLYILDINPLSDILFAKGMDTHSSILAWRIPWTEESGTVHGVAKSQTWLNNSLLHSVSGLSILLIVSFIVQKLFSLMQSQFFIFTFGSFAWGYISKKILIRPLSKSVLCVHTFFISRSYTVSSLTYKSLFYFAFIFVHGMREYSSLII